MKNGIKNIAYEEKIIPLSFIDKTDTTCLLGLAPDPGNLVEAIRHAGIINPPLVRALTDSTYSIICGFRRVAACTMLGLEEIPVRILLGRHTDLETIKIAIWDNVSHRALHVMEQAVAIQKLLAAGEQENLCLKARFPAASLFKIVAAAAAIEARGFHPDKTLTYRGGRYTLYKSQLKKRQDRYSNRISLQVFPLNIT